MKNLLLAVVVFAVVATASAVTATAAKGCRCAERT
jgi:hypothetical protein